MRQFPSLVHTSGHLNNPTHGIEHTIHTGDAEPIRQKMRKVSPENTRIIQKEFDHLEKLGIVRPSKSPWASPLHMVTKTVKSKDGSDVIRQG